MRSMTLDEFVQQVYYAQEKVLLDFEFTDDKYREVIMELRLVLQELQKEEDWLWLRERLILGTCDDFGKPGSIPEFRLPDWVYKPSGLHDDGIRMCRPDECGNPTNDFYTIPFSSMGEMNGGRRRWYGEHGQTNYNDNRLCAAVIGRIVTFNRVLSSDERHRIAVMDVQREIEMPDIPPRADEFEKMDADKQAKISAQYKLDKWFDEIPDPNYLVMRVAALHCVGSPVAQMRMQDLTDNAQKLLSAMREANAMATQPDHIGWDIPGWYEVV